MEFMQVKYDIKQACPIPPPYGGVTIYVKRLIQRLTQDGFTVGGYYTDANRNPEISSSPLFDKAQYERADNLIVRLCNHVLRCLRNIREMMPYRMVHYHGLENMGFIWVLYFCCNKKVIITVHSAMIESFYRRTSLLNKYFMRILAGADIQWVAVSEQARTCMLRLPFPFKNTIPVIPAYVPDDVSDMAPLAPDLSDYIDRHRYSVGFYARSFMLNDGVDVYGFDSALRLYANILKASGLPIGFIMCLSESSDVDQIEALHRRARELDIDDKIFWQIGAIDNIHSLWQRIDVYIRPTSTDGDSVAVREVLDSGAAVVASDVCWRPDGVVLYHFGDDGDFCDKVIEALHRGRRMPQQNYSCYESMLSIYRKMLK